MSITSGGHILRHNIKVNVGVLQNNAQKMIIFILYQTIVMKATVSFAAAEGNFLSRSAYLVTRENQHLASYVVKQFESPSLMACSQSCLRKSWCTSTNFKKFSGQRNKTTCELNKHDFDPINDNTKLIDQPGSIFSMFLKGCLKSGCINGGSCRFNKKEETFTCSCKRPWSGDKCEVETAILGYFRERPGKSCMEIKTIEGERALSGKYWLNNTGSTFPVYCHMESSAEVWTLIARFSNNDTNNWMNESGDWWYDKNVTKGKTTDPSNNFDMISSAFWLVSGDEFKITRSDDPQHTALLQTTGDCLSGQTFRSKITSYGDFRNGSTWRADKLCLGNCTVQYGGQYETTEGFSKAKCNGTILSADRIGFWCERGKWDGSVMMIGGSGYDDDVCNKTDRGIGITVAKEPSFISTKGRVGRDFGNATYGNATKVYSLNLWIR